MQLQKPYRLSENFVGAGAFLRSKRTWNSLCIAIFAFILLCGVKAAVIFAQGQTHERFIVIRPGESAVFHRHPSYRLPGGGFTLRYKFEGHDKVIWHICDKIASERNTWAEIASSEDEMLNNEASLRLEEELTRTAIEELAHEETASESENYFDFIGSEAASPLEHEKPAPGNAPDAGIIIDNQ